MQDLDDKRSPDSKALNCLNDFKDILDEFYYDTQEVKPDNEAQEKDKLNR